MSTIITLVRDSISVSGGQDAMRSVTVRGGELAYKLRIKLEEPRFDVVISSDRRRSVQTAKIVAGHDNTDENPIVIPELWMREGSDLEQPMMMAAQDLGDGTLVEYFSVMRCELITYGLNTSNKLVQVIEANEFPKEVLVVGHSVLLQALALSLCGKETGIVGVALGPCQGFHLEMQDPNNVRLVDHIII